MVYSYYRNKIDKPIWGCAITPTAMIQTFVCPKSSFCADFFHLPCSRPSSPRMVEFYRLLGVCPVCGLAFHEFGVQVILVIENGIKSPSLTQGARGRAHRLLNLLSKPGSLRRIAKWYRCGLSEAGPKAPSFLSSSDS